MKNILIFLLLILVCRSYGQGIRYEKSLDKALEKANEQKKPVFIALILPPRPNQTFESGIDKPDVVKKFNKLFVNYQISLTDSGFSKIREKYQPTLYPTYLFLDRTGGLIYRDSRNFTTAKKYLDMADSALFKMKGPKLSDYESNYKKGKMEMASLKSYIALKEKLGLYDNARLIEEYVGYLTINSLNNYQDVLFILKAGPLAYNKAFNLAYTDRKIVDSIYKKEPAADRVAINNHIINNTYNEAVKTKSNALALQLSNFVRGTYSKDYVKGNNAATIRLLNYYQAIKDTANYLRQSIWYYDNYMRVTADSAKKLADTAHATILRNLNAGRKIISADSLKKLREKNPSMVTVKQSFTTVTTFIDVSTILNNAAYSVYTTGTHNPNYIIKAIGWSRRSIELKPIAGYYDTLAHLLYIYGFYAEAEATQNKAIELSNKESSTDETKHLQQEYLKIKARRL